MNTRTKIMLVVPLMALTAGGVWLSLDFIKAKAKPRPRPAGPVVIGVFDNRAVGVAYAHSAYCEQYLADLDAQHKQALADGDREKAAQIEQQGESQQQKLHMIGFAGRYPGELLALVQDKMHFAAENAGVDLIVGEVLYQSPDLKVVDVTHEVARLYNPREKAWQIIDGLKDWQPCPPEKIEQMHANE